jgi:hypothetical protein
MTRLGSLLRLSLIALVGCSLVPFNSAQSPRSPNISDLDRMMNEASQPGPYGPDYANARGKVKEISKKEITIVQPDGQELTFRLDPTIRTEEGRNARELKKIKLSDIGAGDGVLVRFIKRADPDKALAVFVVRVSIA